MSESWSPTERSLTFTAGDGTTLVGDLVVPPLPRGAAVLLHPHPLYGGNRHNSVISALHVALPEAAVASLRFDFRAEFSDGVGERLDAVAAVDRLAAAVPDVPIALIGYSFGAGIALGSSDRRIDAIVAVAPPLAMMADLPAPGPPTLVLTPAHDQISPPAGNQAIVERWRRDGVSTVEHDVIEMADHSLVGSTAVVAERSVAWLALKL